MDQEGSQPRPVERGLGGRDTWENRGAGCVQILPRTRGQLPVPSSAIYSDVGMVRTLSAFLRVRDLPHRVGYL